MSAVSRVHAQHTQKFTTIRSYSTFLNAGQKKKLPFGLGGRRVSSRKNEHTPQKHEMRVRMRHVQPNPTKVSSAFGASLLLGALASTRGQTTAPSEEPQLHRPLMLEQSFTSLQCQAASLVKPLTNDSKRTNKSAVSPVQHQTYRRLQPHAISVAWQRKI